MLDGRPQADPDRSLISHRRPDRLPGYDLTFSAPKGVSLLFALSEAPLALAVRRGVTSLTGGRRPLRLPSFWIILRKSS